MLIDYKNNLPAFIQFVPSNKVQRMLIANAMVYKHRHYTGVTVDEAIKAIIRGMFNEGWKLEPTDVCLRNKVVAAAFRKYLGE